MVTEGVAHVESVANDPEGDRDGHADAVPPSVGDVLNDEHTDAVRLCDTDDVADGQRETEPESDATVADAVGVDPAGAQSGPMLNVARCVPSSDARGVEDAADGEAVLDARTLA